MKYRGRWPLYDLDEIGFVIAMLWVPILTVALWVLAWRSGQP